MQLRRVLLPCACVLFPAISSAGTAYYVDCDAVQNGDGAHARPWNNVGSVNGKAFKSGDDVYFKVGSTCSAAHGTLDRLVVDWQGTSGDWVTIGAYHGNNLFGLNGGARPLLDANHAIPGNHQALIHFARSVQTDAYVEIRDLKIYDTYGYYNSTSDHQGSAGIIFNNARHARVQNCWIEKTFSSGISPARSSYVEVLHNRLKDNSENERDYNQANHASIEVTGMDNEHSHHNIVRGNVVSGARESIGFYKNTHHSIMEYNVVYGAHKGDSGAGMFIYADGAPGNIFRYNLVYGGNGIQQGDSGIEIYLEGPRCTYKPSLYGNMELDPQIYGNLISGPNLSDGIEFGMDRDCYDIGARFSHAKIYNNTVVGLESNGLRLGGNANGGRGNEVINNIFWTAGVGGLVSGSPTSAWSFDNNMFDGDPGAPWRNGYIDDIPQISRTTGWESIAGGSLAGSEFSLRASSPAVDAGISIGGYDERVSAADYGAWPIWVITIKDSPPDLGAWSYVREAPPDNLPPVILSTTPIGTTECP